MLPAVLDEPPVLELPLADDPPSAAPLEPELAAVDAHVRLLAQSFA
jgi:hypothetical protein